VTVRVNLKSNALVLEVVVLTVIGVLQSSCSSSPATPPSTARSEEGHRQSAPHTSNASVSHLLCPTFGPPPKPRTLNEKRDHTVILSWTASAPADSKHAAAVGYCIYRSEKRGDKSPELVNSISFPGTSCMDDMVENGKKYYYVARAINAQGVPSIPSNVATAPIPSGKEKKGSVSGNTAPLCREPTK
jgi:hypothetical protein